jgi:NDP-sugar pyrophosphorylase family protein/mannose-6-phosphate isomerase-like protein (cupin superfamily)
MKLQVVIPMAGLGSRFNEYGFTLNKYLLPINLDLDYMIEAAITSLSISSSIECHYFFIINEQKGHDAELRQILHTICEKHGFSYTISSVAKLTEGPASTVNHIRNIIDMQLPLLVSNSDQILVWNFDKFMTSCQGYDSCVLTYHPPYQLLLGATDKHSFVHINETTGRIDECREKIVLSDRAIVGTHYYTKADFFYDAYDHMVRNNIRAPNGEFYMSLSNQAMIEQGRSVGYHDMDDNERFYPVGEPDDYFNYLYCIGGYQHSIKSLRPNDVFYQNDGYTIKYMNINNHEVNRIINPGLLILLSGSVHTRSNVGTIANSGTVTTYMTKYEITNDDVLIESDCELISIAIDSHANLVEHSKTVWSPSQFIRGWIMGQFTPSIINNEHVELGILTHNKGEKWGYHYHKECDELNVLLEGSMLMNNREIKKHDIFFIQKKQLGAPIFLENCRVLCIKYPSIPKDKIIV